MKLACWKIVVSNWTPGKTRLQAGDGLLDAMGELDEFAHGSFSTTRSSPGSSLMTASPISGWWSSLTVATSPSAHRLARPVLHRDLGQVGRA